MAIFGSRTDIIKIREAVARLADLDALRPKLPVTTDTVVVNDIGMADDVRFTGAMVTAAVTTLRDALTAHVVDPPNPRATLYYGLISQTLHFLQDTMPALPDIPVNPINKYIYDTLGRMGDLIVDMVGHEATPSVFTNKVDLVMEDIFHVMAMAQVPRTDIPAMLNPIGALAPNGGAVKRSYIFNSGMKCTTCIASALHAMQAGIGARFTVGYASDIYFESRSLIAGDHAERAFAPPTAIAMGMGAGNVDRDVFFFDFLPNAAAELRDVSEHRGVDVVTRAIVGRNPAHPVTVVIDTTTDVFDGARTVDVLADPGIAAAINDGTLNLVVVDSLAKFAQAGRDKYTGGVIQTYNNGNAYFNDFNTALADMQATPEYALSDPANRFFAAMLDPVYARPSFEGQLAQVRASTNALSAALRSAAGPGEAPPIHVMDAPNVLQALEALEPPNTRRAGAPEYVPSGPSRALVNFGGRPCIELTSRSGHGDSDIPMLGLKLNRLMGDRIDGGWTDNGDVRTRTFGLIHNYLLAVCQARDLPLNTRGSFGFDHATLTGALPPNTMRLTVGLEDAAQVTAYATILRQASVDIDAHFGDAGRFGAYVAVSDGIKDQIEDPVARTAIMKKSEEYRVRHGGDIPFDRFIALCSSPDPALYDVA